MHIVRKTTRTSTGEKQKGQAIVLGMFLMLVAAASVIVLYNTAQVATEKSRLVNAADAAAYSGGVWTARQLNFMAYTNRAMLSNHVMAGHLVSYISWLRYVEDAMDNIESLTSVLRIVTSWIPYVGAIIAAIDRAADLMKELAEALENITTPIGKGFLAAVDIMNLGLSLSQRAAWLNMQSPIGEGGVSSPLHQVMNNSARYHNEAENIQVNEASDLDNAGAIISGVTMINEFAKLTDFSQGYHPYGDSTRSRMEFMVNQSKGPSERWIDQRTWRSDFLGIIKWRKEAGTSQDLPAYDGDNGEWNADDRMRYKLPFGKWKTVGSGEASARESNLWTRYKGIPKYFDLEELRPEDRNLQLNITAYATMPMTETNMKELLGMGGGPEKLAAVSRARIFHQRPQRSSNGNIFRADGEFEDFGSTNKEYANVFNPFWDSKLTSPPSLF